MDLDADFERFESGGGIHIPGNPANNISVRQNNPFNIKGNYWGAVGTGTRGFAVYPTPAAGWQAGVNQLALDHSRPFTVRQFQEKYAPSYENPTYLRDLTKLTGTSPDDPISKIPLNTLIQSVAKLESGARGPLPRGDFRGVEKVAAKTKKIDLDADFEEFEQQQPVTQQVPPGTKITAPPPAPASNVQESINKDFPREAPPQATPWNPLTAPTKTWGPRIMQALALPHEKISKPAAEWLHPKLPEVLQGDKKLPVKERQEILANLIDFPVYGGVDKLVRGVVGGAKAIMGLKAPKAVPTPSPAGGPSGISEGMDLEERMAAAAAVGGSPELGIEAATKAPSMATPSFLHPPTTPWAAGPIQRGLPATTTPPGRAVPVYPNVSRMERPQMALPPGESTVEVLPAVQPPAGRAVPVYPRGSKMKVQPALPGGVKGTPSTPPPPFSWPTLDDEIKAIKDANKTKAILRDIKGMKGMGHDEEVSRLLEMLSKLGGG